MFFGRLQPDISLVGFPLTPAQLAAARLVVRARAAAHRTAYPVTGDLTLDPKDAKTAPSTAIDAHAGDSRIPILLCGP